MLYKSALKKKPGTPTSTPLGKFINKNRLDRKARMLLTGKSSTVATYTEDTGYSPPYVSDVINIARINTRQLTGKFPKLKLHVLHESRRVIRGNSKHEVFYVFNEKAGYTFKNCSLERLVKLCYSKKFLFRNSARLELLDRLGHKDTWTDADTLSIMVDIIVDRINRK